MQKAFFATLSFIFILWVQSPVFSQEHVHGETCVQPGFVAHSESLYPKIEALENSLQFRNKFKSKYLFDYSSFIEVNGYFTDIFKREIVDATFGESNIPESRIENLLFELIEEYKRRDDLWFEIPAGHGIDKIFYGKHIFNPVAGKEGNDDGAPKTLDCFNAGFENGNWNGWQTLCATATNGFNYLSPQAYVPPGGCTSPSQSNPGQHSLVTGGTDGVGGFPRVFQGGVSAMLGNGAQAGSPVHQAAVLRKTFVVDPDNTLVTYSYAAVLDNRGGHTAAQQPFFNVRILVDGNSDPCAAYSATAGDGQPGWVNSGNIFYRDWTTIAVPLEAYVNQTVTLEFSVSDCFVSGGIHYAYAYIDVSCDNLEVEQFCLGGSTILAAPTQGISSYLWSPGGQTTSQITVTTPGIYTVDVIPFGSTCPITITYDASIYPVPQADFSLDNTSICVGGNVNFTDLSTVEVGGTITGYQWNFGDGISTPSSTGSISGVPQTTGTYTAPNHTYNNIGNPTITLTIETSDGCTSSHQTSISVIQGPEATISGNNVVCDGDPSPEITFTGSQTPGPYTFTYNIDNGPDQTVSTTAPNSSVTVPVPTTPPGTYTYNLTYISDPSSAQCEQAQTGSVSILVNPLPTATIGTPATVCQGDTQPQITFTGSNGTGDYMFTYSLNGQTNQTISTSGSNTATINVSTAVAGTFEYTLLSVEDIATGCSQAVSAPGNTSTIIVNPMPDATIAGTTVVCQNDAQPQVTFTGTNSSGEYTFTYSITPGTSTTITTSGSDQATVNVPTDDAGTFIYELINVSDPATGCNQNVNETQTILVNPLPTATISGTTTLCQYSPSPQITFTGNDGTSEYAFTYSINGAPHQTITTSGSNSITVDVPTDIAIEYDYTLHSVTDVTTGCSQAQTGVVTVIINPMPNASTSGTTTVCQNSPAPLVSFIGQNSSGEYTFTYNVNLGSVQTITTSGSNIATVAQTTAVPGTYTYQLTNVMDPVTLCNQDINHTETITVNPLPVATISAPTAACHMDTNLPEVTFSGSFGDAPYIFTYNLNGGGDLYASSTGSDVTFQVPTGTVGTFVYTITNIQEGSSLGCQQAQNVSTMVTIHALPNVSAGNNFSVCAGVPIILTGSGAQFYDWDNGVTNGVPFTPNDTTTYTVLGTDHNGCQNTDQITVSVVPIPVMDFTGENLYGCSPLTPTFTNHSTGTLTNCSWYLGNGEVLQGCGSVSSVFEEAGCFDVTLVVSTPEGCSNSLTINNYVCVEANPIADFYPDPSDLTSYNWETQMINQTTGAISYEWNFGDGTGPSYEHSPFHSYPNDHSGTYQVMLVAASSAGCLDTAYATVNLKEELLFYVPNTFTPDGDDYNETFTPIFATGFDPYGYTMYIFNRWGELVFETHNTEIGWNGRYGVDGRVCQDGTYVWKIDVKMKSSSEHRQYVGHVNILR